MCERARQQLHRPYVAQKSVVCCFSILRQKRLRACRSAKFNLRSGRKTPAPVFTDSGERSLRVAAEKPRSQSRNSPQNKYYATYHFTSAPRITSCRAHRCAGARVWAFSGCGARWRVLDLQLLLSRQPILAAVPAVTATIRLMAHGRAGTVQGVSVKGASGVKACSQKSRTGFLNARTDFLNARTGLRKVFNKIRPDF